MMCAPGGDGRQVDHATLGRARQGLDQPQSEAEVVDIVGDVDRI
jgi:hypothetical protein